MKSSSPIGFGLAQADRIPPTSPSRSAPSHQMAIPLRVRSPPLLTSASLAATVPGGFSSFPYAFNRMVLPNDIDLLNPPAELEKRRHKLKRLVQSPNSFFMDVKCQGCFNITTVFSHSQTVVVCGNCQTVLCQPTGGRARLTEGCSFRRKGD
ncbi:zinc finger protein [Musa troglodytarum]|uniref:40S ribosomal protein S27 n=1 Tax=Musa troglodytarum TaxID=320322 RepID=A0A9E7ESQ7_9LILI|nr:zinc finger protein [Musa troglodytarum]